jgi:hypothetical protein
LDWLIFEFMQINNVLFTSVNVVYEKTAYKDTIFIREW